MPPHEEAKDKIARLIREAIPAAPQLGNGLVVISSGRSNLNIVAGGNVTSITVEGAGPVLPPPRKAMIDRAAIVRRIEATSRRLGDPMLHIPFIRTVFKTEELGHLTDDQLERVSRWLGQ